MIRSTAIFILSCLFSNGTVLHSQQVHLKITDEKFLPLNGFPVSIIDSIGRDTMHFVTDANGNISFNVSDPWHELKVTGVMHATPCNDGREFKISEKIPDLPQDTLRFALEAFAWVDYNIPTFIFKEGTMLFHSNYDSTVWFDIRSIDTTSITYRDLIFLADMCRCSGFTEMRVNSRYTKTDRRRSGKKISIERAELIEDFLGQKGARKMAFVNNSLFYKKHPLTGADGTPLPPTAIVSFSVSKW